MLDGDIQQAPESLMWPCFTLTMLTANIKRALWPDVARHSDAVFRRAEQACWPFHNAAWRPLAATRNTASECRATMASKPLPLALTRMGAGTGRIL
jgi:hypothetical protein